MEIERGTERTILRLNVERLCLKRGEVVALTGPSGCGKSTLLDVLAMMLWQKRARRLTVLRHVLLKLLSGGFRCQERARRMKALRPEGRMQDATEIRVRRMKVLRPEGRMQDATEIRVRRMKVLRPEGRMQDATEILEKGQPAEAARLRAAAIGYVLQTGGLLPFLTVCQNLMVADPLGQYPRDELPARIKELAEKLDICATLHEWPGDLSVGQRQRAAILRAIIKKPTVLLADEPTSNLDPDTSKRTLGLLCDLAREAKAAVLVVSHDHALIQELGLRRLKLKTCSSRQGEQSGKGEVVVVESRLHGPCPPLTPAGFLPGGTTGGPMAS